MKKENTLKLSIPVTDLKITLWTVLKRDLSYIMFKASIMSSKKNEDGTWLNEYNYITCFAYNEIMHKINEIYQEKKKLQISGTFSFMPEQREVTGKNGNYNETIYTKPSLIINSFEEFAEDGKTIHYKSKSSNDKSQEYNEDIPF